MPLIPELGRQRQAYFTEFEINLNYIVSSKTVRATQKPSYTVCVYTLYICVYVYIFYIQTHTRHCCLFQLHGITAAYPLVT